MANVVYNEYKNNLILGSTPFSAATTAFGVYLVTSGYTPTEGDTFSDTSTYEVSTAGYSRQQLSGVTVTKVEVGGGATGVDDYYKVDATDSAFGPNVTITAAGAIVFQKDTNLTNTPTSIVTFVDFSGSKSSSNGDFTVVWNANGILNFKQGA
tara:strand:+ start:927 stop:1385 length:459 start_codon:yes stop_codon:yes gene_type:complete